MKFGKVRGVVIRHLFSKFSELWSAGPAVPWGDMHQSFSDALVIFSLSGNICSVGETC